MRHLILFLLLTLFLIAGCRSGNKNAEDSGGRILSKNEMIEFLTDLQLSEAAIRSVQDPSATDSTQRRLFFYDLYKKHDITPSDFNASLNYYLLKVNELDEIYDEVIANLNTRESEFRSKNSGKPKVVPGAKIREPED